MGGVDLQDYRCKKVRPSIHSKKWTWSVFIRLLQSSLTNATVLWNLCQKEGAKKMKTRDLCMKVTEKYLQNSKHCVITYDASHKYISKQRNKCSAPKCNLRTTRYCLDCTKYYCVKCFSELHQTNPT